MATSAFLKIPWKEGLFFKRDSKFDQLFHVSSHQAHNQVSKKNQKTNQQIGIYLIFFQFICRIANWQLELHFCTAKENSKF